MMEVQAGENSRSGNGKQRALLALVRMLIFIFTKGKAYEIVGFGYTVEAASGRQSWREGNQQGHYGKNSRQILKAGSAARWE